MYGTLHAAVRSVVAGFRIYFSGAELRIDPPHSLSLLGEKESCGCGGYFFCYSKTSRGGRGMDIKDGSCLLFSGFVVWFFRTIQKVYGQRVLL